MNELIKGRWLTTLTRGLGPGDLGRGRGTRRARRHGRKRSEEAWCRISTGELRRKLMTSASGIR